MQTVQGSASLHFTPESESKLSEGHRRVISQKNGDYELKDSHTFEVFLSSSGYGNN